MTNTNELAMEIREVFFNHTRNMSIEFHKGSIKEFLGDLERVISASFISLLQFNEWTCSYTAITADEKTSPFKIEELIDRPFQPTNLDAEGKYCFLECLDENLYIFKYDLEDFTKPFYFVFQNNESKMNKSILMFICKEFEHFLKMYAYKNCTNKKLNYSNILNRLSEKIYSTSSRQSALTHFVKYFERAYPFLQYEILLAQDYKVKCDLPVRELMFDYEGVRLVDQAFLTGEIKTISTNNTIKMYVPLRGNQGTYGVLEIEARDIKQIPEIEIDTILKFANICGQALENVSLYQHSISLVSDLKLINDATKKLNMNTDIDRLTSIVIKHISEASSAEEIGVILFDERNSEKNTISQESTSYFKNNDNEAFIYYLKDTCLKHSRIFSGNFSNILKASPYESIMALPMIHTDQKLGVIIIMHRNKYFFSFETFKFIQSLVQHYTLTVSNTILKNQLEEAVITDYLTGLYARNYLDEMTKKHMKTDEYGVLVLFDIDDFKEINDTYGHSVGDQVIIQISKILKEKVSNQDIAARWGGEELALYLPNRTVKEGYSLAQEILKTVEKVTEPRVTLSCGIGSWNPGLNHSVKELFICTDQALYSAKSLGKNQIVISQFSYRQ